MAYDATSLYGPRTGVGTFAAEVLTRLADDVDLDIVCFAATWRGRGQLPSLVPRGVRAASRPMAARPLRELWLRREWPPIEWWTGRVDIVHGPNFVVPPARTKGTVRLATVHDLTSVHHPELCTRDTLQYPPLIRRAVRAGAHLQTVSDFVRNEIIELLAVPAHRVHVVPNGIGAPVPGDQAAGHQLAGGNHYLLALGTIEPRKGLPVLVKAFDELAARDRDLRLVVAGPDGWGRDALDAAVAAAAHRHRIIRLGWVDQQQRADLLAGATAFAFPSLYEGFGLPPLEAMQAGVPVVATTAGALPEIAGPAAELVTPGDADALAAGLRAVLDDAAYRDQLVTRGHEHAARFRWDHTAQQLAALYRGLADS